MKTGTQEFRLISNDPVLLDRDLVLQATRPKKADLIFKGVVIFELEQPWHGDEAFYNYCEGAIAERIAIYRKVGKRRFFHKNEPDEFIAEQCRYANQVVILNPLHPIPFFSLARRFPTIEKAAHWLRIDSIASEGVLRNQLENALKNINTGQINAAE